MILRNKRQFVTDMLLVFLGNLVLAAGVAFFIVPNNILSGGVAGVAVAIQPFISFVSEADIISILTIAFFFLGAIFLGKDFAFKTLLSSILYPFFVEILGRYVETISITSDPLLASLYGGVLTGIGVGLVFRTGASTGGMDIPSLILHKYTHVPLATTVIIVDALTVLFGMAIYGIEPALIGLISVWTGGYALNKTMLLGSSDAKSVMIISDKYDEILAEIYKAIDRGATLLHGEGGFTRGNKKILMIVILQSQFPIVNRIVHSIDPGAFVIIHDVHEVLGEGFTYDQKEDLLKN